jgi:hypothetical protein
MISGRAGWLPPHRAIRYHTVRTALPVSWESLSTPSKARQLRAGRLGAANRTQAAERPRPLGLIPCRGPSMCRRHFVLQRDGEDSTRRIHFRVTPSAASRHSVVNVRISTPKATVR